MSQLTLNGAAMKRTNGAGIDVFGVLRKSALLFAVGACILASGCKGSQMTWSAEAKSPDGKMVATASAFANGGFGASGAPATFVYLNWATGSQKPVQILGLESESDAPDDAKVGMNWLTPSHLELTYKSTRQHIGFQAVKFVGVDISLRDLSSSTTSAVQ